MPGEQYTNMDPRKTDATDEVYPVKDMPQLHKKMGRDVSESSPGSIVDYFDTMEATMNGLVKSDRLKKFYVVEHLGDWAMKELWKALPQYATGTYPAFRKAVLSHYPEAADLVRGSRERLEEIFARHQNISVGNYGVMMRFALQVRRAAGLLIKQGENTSRALVTNLDLCRMIYGSLDKEFEESVKFRLNMKPPTPDPEGAEKDDIDFDPFSWEEVLKTAEGLAKQYQGQGYQPAKRATAYEAEPMALSRPLTQVKPLREIKLEEHPGFPRAPEVESELAQIKDLLVLQRKQTETFQTEVQKQLQKLELETAQLREINQVQHQSEPARQAPQQNLQREYAAGPSQNNRPPQMQQPRGQRPPCYYCGTPGHFQGDCFSRNAHRNEGLLVLRDGKMFVKATGQPLPMVAPTGGSLKDYVEQVSGRSVNMQHGWDGEYISDSQRIDYTMMSLGDQVASLAQQVSRLTQGFSSQAANQAPPKTTEEMVKDLYHLSFGKEDF